MLAPTRETGEARAPSPMEGRTLRSQGGRLVVGLPSVILQLTRKGGDPGGWIWKRPLCRSPASKRAWQSLGNSVEERGEGSNGGGRLRVEPRGSPRRVGSGHGQKRT